MENSCSKHQKSVSIKCRKLSEHSNTKKINDNKKKTVTMSVNSTDNEAMEFNNINHRSVIIPFAVVFSVIAFVGIVSNFLIIVFFGIKRGNTQNLSTYHVFIAILAVCDFLSCVFGLLVDGTQVFFGRWLYGGFLCSALVLFKPVFLFVSYWIVAGMALERYRGIVHPFHRNFKGREVFMFCVVVFLIGLALYVPMFMSVSYKHGRCLLSLLYSVFSKKTLIIYMTFKILLQTIIPLCIMIQCSRSIKVALLQGVSFVDGRGTHNRDLPHVVRARSHSKSVLKTLHMVNVLFVVSFAPSTLNAIVQIFLTNIPSFETYRNSNARLAVLLVLYATTYLNSALNGFIYAKFIPEFRGFVQSRFCWKKSGDADSAEN